jgi:hypothetical protein
MNIELRNFGPIEEFSIDLKKDFHLIVGKNNVGKSYAITATYLIIRAFQETRMSPLRMHLLLDDSNLEDVTDQLKRTINPARKEVSIKNQYLNSLKSILQNTFLEELLKFFEGTYDSIKSLQNAFSEKDMEIKISIDGFCIFINQVDDKIEISKIETNRAISLKTIKQTRHTIFEKNRILVYANEKSFGKIYNTVFTSVIKSISNIYMAVDNICGDIHYLPASRSGLYQSLSAFGQIIASLSQSRSLLSTKIELPAISIPLSDYFIKLSGIKDQPESKNTNLKTVDVANKIEEEILKGRVRFDESTKKLFFKPNDTNLDLDLSATSSMVSELSPIVAYLRFILTNTRRTRSFIPQEYRSRRKHGSAISQIIIIEEPEAHLHPEVQVKLTELFCDLLDGNVKIIMTSHSNYIFTKINNLIISKSLSPEIISAYYFYNRKSGSIGEALEVDELGINDINFTQTSEDLYNEKISSIEKLNESN